MTKRLFYLGKCKKNKLKLYFNDVYDFYKKIAIKRGLNSEKIVFHVEKKWVKIYTELDNFDI